MSNKTETMYVYNIDTMIIVAEIKHFLGKKGCEQYYKELYNTADSKVAYNKYSLIDNGDQIYHKIHDENGLI